MTTKLHVVLIRPCPCIKICFVGRALHAERGVPCGRILQDFFFGKHTRAQRNSTVGKRLAASVTPNNRSKNDSLCKPEGHVCGGGKTEADANIKQMLQNQRRQSKELLHEYLKDGIVVTEWGCGSPGQAERSCMNAHQKDGGRRQHLETNTLLERGRTPNPFALKSRN